MAARSLGRLIALPAAIVLAFSTLTACQNSNGAGDDEEFPTRSISMVVGFAPGGGADVFARALTQASEKTLPESIVVENREGGGGTSGSAFVKGQPADGYTILFGHAGSSILTPVISERPELKWDAFDPIARIHAEEEFLFLRPDAEWKTIDEVVEHARQNPGAVRVAGSAVGGVDSFVIIQLQEAADVEFTYVPFDGGGPASLSFLGGNVDLLVGNFSDNAASIESGEMFPIAVASKERGTHADVPTLSEHGWDVVLQQWRGVFAPKGTPPERIQILADGFEAALEEDAWVNYRETSQSVDAFLGPDQFSAFLTEEEGRFVPMIDELGLKGN